MPTILMAWPLKRSAIARLKAYADGTYPAPPNITPLVGVQVGFVLPANPDRVCVYGTPVNSTRRYATEERGLSVESVRMEIRVRVYQPGEADEDIGDVDTLTGQLCQAVASALIDYEPVVDQTMGTMTVAQVIQWPTAVTPFPEPSVTGLASVLFQADVITT